MRFVSSLRRCFRLAALLPFLGGCAAQAVTYEQAANAIRKCGMIPDEVLWRIGEKGEVVFGRKSAETPGPTYEQLSCFMEWATENKVKVALVGWEANGT